MSTPYLEDGAVDYDGLRREAGWVIRCSSPGAIWCQSNDSIDLLTTEEKFRGFEVCAAAFENAPTVLALGANGTNATEMLEIAAEIERIAARHPATKLAIVSRPPDDVRCEEELEAAWDALGSVVRRPVILQTFCSTNTPTPSVEMMVRLAKKHPDVFGYIKEEAAGNSANERMILECAAKPTVKTVFSGWGGWQWLYQLRHCGSEGLITERVAYLPLIMKIWREYERGDPEGKMTESFAMYRLLIDQRNFPGGGLRDYSLYFLEKEGIFKNRVSRRYANARETEGGSFGTDRLWKLDSVEISDRQRRELDLLYEKIKEAL
jgi:dihydrodipicolinate synthase/N-acetylneuraminate lyase